MPAGYDNPFRATYSYSAVSFASSSTKIIRGPKGKRGRLADVMAGVTTSFVGTSSPAALRLGPSGALTALLDMNFGTTGSPTQAGTTLNASNVTGALKGSPGARVFADADTDLTLGIIAGVGTPAGVADLQITMEWF